MRLFRLISAVAICMGLVSANGFAADHLDSPSVTDDATTDITDVFAWMNDDADKLNLVLAVNTSATTETEFSDSAQYVFHIDSQESYGAEEKTTVQVICTFDSDQVISCWAGSDYVTGDASAAAGLDSTGGTFKVFAGLRNDPFFFNFGGLTDTIAFVKENADALTFNDASCPTLDAATSTAIVSRLQGTEDGTEDAADSFAGTNVMAIVVQIDLASVNAGGAILSVYGSTHSAE